MKQNSRAGLSRKAWSKEEIEDSVKTRVKHKELLELSLAILDGNDESAEELSKLAVEAGFSVNRLLKACYEGAKAADELHIQRLCEKRSLMMTVEAFLSAMAPFKEKLRDAVKTGTVVLGAMESDGEESATVYTLPLLEAFGHRTRLVVSFYPEWYIEETIKSRPDVVCLTCVRAGARHYIKGVIEGLKKAGLYDKITCLGCGTHLTKREALRAGCHQYARGYLQIPQIVNEIIKKKSYAT